MPVRAPCTWLWSGAYDGYRSLFIADTRYIQTFDPDVYSICGYYLERSCRRGWRWTCTPRWNTRTAIGSYRADPWVACERGLAVCETSIVRLDLLKEHYLSNSTNSTQCLRTVRLFCPLELEFWPVHRTFENTSRFSKFILMEGIGWHDRDITWSASGQLGSRKTLCTQKCCCSCSSCITLGTERVNTSWWWSWLAIRVLVTFLGLLTHSSQVPNHLQMLWLWPLCWECR